MILPFYNKFVFCKALELVKNNSFKFIIFKYLFNYLWFIVKRFELNFEIIEINSNFTDDYHTIIFPPYVESNKITLLKYNNDEVFIRKIGFNINNPKINLEYQVYNSELKHIPKVLNYSKTTNKTTLDIQYFFGKYPKKLNNKIITYINKLPQKEFYLIKNHPFYLEMLIELEKHNKEDIYIKFINFIKNKIEQSSMKIPVSLMHGDFSLTNILINKNDFLIFDWEHSTPNGLPIDLNYYKLRLMIDNEKFFPLINEKDYLSLLYYFYFAYKNNIMHLLNKHFFLNYYKNLKKN